MPFAQLVPGEAGLPESDPRASIAVVSIVTSPTTLAVSSVDVSAGSRPMPAVSTASSIATQQATIAFLGSPSRSAVDCSVVTVVRLWRVWSRKSAYVA